MRLGALLALALLLPALAEGATGKWKRGAPLPLARGEVAAAVAEGRIYVVGGFTGTVRNSTRVEAYSPTTNSWSQEADLPVSVDHTMAAGHRGRVYVAGGYGPDRAQLTSLFAFTGDGWTRLAPMPEPRAAGGAAIVNGKLYVVGGTTAGQPEARQDDARVRHRERTGGRRAAGRLRASTSASPRSADGSTQSAGELPASTRTWPWSRGSTRSTGRWVSAPESPGTARRHRRGGHGPLDRVRRRRGARGNDPHRVPIRRHPPSLVAAPEPPDSQARARRRRSRPEGLRDRRRDEARALGQPGERVSGGSIGKPVTTSRRPPAW